MKNSFFGEIIISVALLLLFLLFLRPLQPMMPSSMHTVMVPLLVVLFIIFIAVFWKEVPGDEREQLHQFLSARFAYFAGVTTLIVGIIIENFQHYTDPWLIIAICILLLAKIAGRIYGYMRH